MKFNQQVVLFSQNDDGFALISTLLILAILTFIGIAATNTTTFELKIAGNEISANKRFYMSDSGWKQAGPYLNSMAMAPNFKNLTLKAGDLNYDWADSYYLIVRNFGDGGDGTLNDGFSAGSQDGSISNVSYWYQVTYQSDSQAIQFGANYRDFQYQTLCNAEGSVEVTTTVNKVFRVGY